MKRLVLAAALAATALVPAAVQAYAPPELCLEFYDPEHAESHFVCVSHVVDGILPG